MAKFNPFDPANGYSEEDRVALSGKCSSLINQAYKNPFPGAALRLRARCRRRSLSGRSGVSFTPSPQSLTYVSSWGFWRLLPCCTQKSIGYVK